MTANTFTASFSDPTTVSNAWKKLRALAEKMARDENTDFDTAFRRVLNDPNNKKLVALIAPQQEEERKMTTKTYATINSKAYAGKQLDNLTRLYMTQHNVDYWTAFNAVRNDPDNEFLVADYAVPDGCRFED